MSPSSLEVVISNIPVFFFLFASYIRIFVFLVAMTKTSYQPRLYIYVVKRWISLQNRTHRKGVMTINLDNLKLNMPRRSDSKLKRKKKKLAFKKKKLRKSSKYTYWHHQSPVMNALSFQDLESLTGCGLRFGWQGPRCERLEPKYDILRVFEPEERTSYPRVVAGGDLPGDIHWTRTQDYLVSLGNWAKV